MLQRTKRAAVALFLALAAWGGVPAAVRAQAMSPEQETAIRKGVQTTLDAYCALAAAGRWDELLRLYADDPRFRWVANGVLEARSVEEIRKYFAALPAGARVENSYKAPEITPIAPGVALVATQFETRLVDPKGGGFSFAGFLTMTLVERGDGWKIISGHSSSPPRHDR